MTLKLCEVQPEPAYCISVGVVKRAVRDWTSSYNRKHWDSVIGLKQAKALIQGPPASKTKELLKLNRNQLRWVVDSHLKGHLKN
jgi:hypothetical protein